MISRHPLPPRPTTVDSRDSNTLQQRWKWWYDKRVESNAKKGMGGGEWEGGLSVVYEVGTVNSISSRVIEGVKVEVAMGKGNDEGDDECDNGCKSVWHE